VDSGAVFSGLYAIGKCMWSCGLGGGLDHRPLVTSAVYALVRNSETDSEGITNERVILLKY